jgi:hypothetical protein
LSADGFRTGFALMTHTARRINQLASRLNLQSYLEIGVCNGDTFCLIEIPDRTGVDPAFRFDPDTLRNRNTRLQRETSDAYFAALPISVKYDAIFIDGLHIFEQVVRDFSNSILHTHDQSVILIDDTLPNDVYSSLRDPLDTSRFRHMVANNSRAWHGDVFKMVFYINDFWPCLNYRTIDVGGNPQTLVWRSPAERHDPICNNMELISRLTYFDLHTHINVLRRAGEEDTIAQCVSELEAQRADTGKAVEAKAAAARQ